MKSEKKMAGPGRALAKILYFVSGRAGLGPKFQFPFRARPGSDLTLIFLTGRAGPGLKNPTRADL